MLFDFSEQIGDLHSVADSAMTSLEQFHLLRIQHKAGVLGLWTSLNKGPVAVGVLGLWQSQQFA